LRCRERLQLRGLAVPPDGHVISGSLIGDTADHTVRVWDPNGKSAPIVFDAQGIDSFRVLPDGRVVMGGDRIVLWDPQAVAARR
jgi:hypothetical protein